MTSIHTSLENVDNFLFLTEKFDVQDDVDKIVSQYKGKLIAMFPFIMYF